jgi:hypothetical protein
MDFKDGVGFIVVVNEGIRFSSSSSSSSPVETKVYKNKNKIMKIRW